MAAPTTDPTRIELSAERSHSRAWPLWAAAAGALGFVSTVVTDDRAGDTSDPDYMVTVADMEPLGHEMYRIGGLTGFVTVGMLLLFAALWHRRVAQRFTWSLGAPIVTYGFISAAAALTLAYGWKASLGNYLHGAMEEGTYDDSGLYVYYVMNDFSPYIGWFPITVALFGLVWMAFRERLVSRALGGVTGFFALVIFGSVVVTGVPGLPFAGSMVLVIVGIWLAVGRSPITQEVTA
ncbi:hypothetical protein [Nocardioides sp.]|uniref:hypothetical protein n=1 Tax=Nocardioides sp. TaxID=35761 RepID=UPI001A2E4E73|nr:hypothetical protein [Nocardioides sp.]MBJ7356078.1 hypothetical protein [Nocardioides sp.]